MVGDQLIFPEFKWALSLLSQSHTGSYTLCAARLFEIAPALIVGPVSPDKVARRWSLALRHQSHTGWFLFLRQTIKTCQETLFDWLIIPSRFCLGHKTRLQCSLAKPFPCSSTTRPNVLKSNLVSHLFHGYQDLARQSSWWSILLCVHVYIHWSKAVALFAQFLSSLPERNSTDERSPWKNYMPRV